MFQRKTLKETQRTLCLYGIFLLFSAFLLSSLPLEQISFFDFVDYVPHSQGDKGTGLERSESPRHLGAGQ